MTYSRLSCWRDPRKCEKGATPVLLRSKAAFTRGFVLLRGFLKRHLFTLAILGADFAVYTWSLNALQDRLCILCWG